MILNHVSDSGKSNAPLGVFDLPESESGFKIMILIHRFI